MNLALVPLAKRLSLASVGLLGLHLTASSDPAASSPPSPASPASGSIGIEYGGRAFGASVDASLLGVSRSVSDTGQLPPTGGVRTAQHPGIRIPGLLGSTLLAAKGMAAITAGANGVANSHATVGGVSLMSGTPAHVSAGFVRAESQATCNGVSGFTRIEGLRVAGQTIQVTGAVNQRVRIPGVATLFINEQIPSGGPGSYGITVNALRLTLLGGPEIIVASAASSIDGCPGCPPVPSCDDYVTGGGWIAHGVQKGTFAVNLGITESNQRLVGLLYEDERNGVAVQATSLDTYVQGRTRWSRHAEGDCKVNGVGGFRYVLDVDDFGRPGVLRDRFSLSLSNGYRAKGVVKGGELDLVVPCP